MKTDLELALECVINIYHQYGKLDLLNFNDFKTLLTEQAPTFLGYRNKTHSIFKETDLNKDKELTFEEFTIVLAKVTDDAHRIIHKDDRCTPDKD
uniref:EF-hand domain-containing protein n=1 Tax=Athene cunicularia TaxID=194338 RepID=A0A663M6D0_ATHCN